MRVLRLLIAIAALALATSAYLYADSSNQYTVEDSSTSPDGQFVATRFQEATPLIACSEVVFVLPSTVRFNVAAVKQHLQYTAFADDCSVEVRTNWSGNSTLEIFSTANRSEQQARENWKVSPLATKINLSFQRMTRTNPMHTE